MYSVSVHLSLQGGPNSLADQSWHSEEEHQHGDLAGAPSISSSDSGVIDWDHREALHVCPGESPAVAPSDFLNFSFKNLELLGERNQEMANTFDGLRLEFGNADPYQ